MQIHVLVYTAIVANTTVGAYTSVECKKNLPYEQAHTNTYTCLRFIECVWETKRVIVICYLAGWQAIECSACQSVVCSFVLYSVQFLFIYNRTNAFDHHSFRCKQSAHIELSPPPHSIWCGIDVNIRFLYCENKIVCSHK